MSFGSARSLLIVVEEGAYFLSHRLPIALAARGAGFQVGVVSRAGNSTEAIRALGFDHFTVPIDRGGMNPWRDMRTAIALTVLYRKVRPDLVHHVSIKPILYGSFAAQRAGVPAVVNAFAGLGYIFTGNTWTRRILRKGVVWLLRRLLGRPGVITLFQNPDDQRALVDADIVPAEQSVLIRGSGVDVDVFKAAPAPDGLPLVVFPSRLLWAKGVGLFVDAARGLREAGVHGRFALVGASDPANPGAVPDSVLARWEREGVVEVWGHRTDIPEVFRQAAIVCLPSEYPEGVPKSLLEAAAVGRPIVTTDAPGCREVVRSGENGFLVPPGSVSAVRDALHRLLTDPSLRAEMGVASRRIAVTEFASTIVAGQTLELYRRLLGARSAHHA